MHLEEEPSHIEGWQWKRAAHITGFLQLASVLRTATLRAFQARFISDC